MPDYDKLAQAYARRNEAMKNLKDAREKAGKADAIGEAKYGIQGKAGQFATMGGSIVPGWGHLIGAGVGLIAGTAEDIQARRSGGQGWGEAIGKGVVDAFNPYTQTLGIGRAFGIGGSGTAAAPAVAQQIGSMRKKEPSSYNTNEDILAREQALESLELDKPEIGTMTKTPFSSTDQLDYQLNEPKIGVESGTQALLPSQEQERKKRSL